MFKSGLITFKDKHTLVKFFPNGAQTIAHSDGVTKLIDEKSYMKIIHPDGKEERCPYRVNKVTLQSYEKDIMPNINLTNDE
jgi:hypothetical protein